MSQGHYPRFIVLQLDSPSKKREIVEGESLEELKEKLDAKAGDVDVDRQLPDEWRWHPLHPDNPLRPENRRRKRRG